MARISKSRRVPRAKFAMVPDGDPNKISPNGLRSTFLAIQNYWVSLRTGRSDLEHLTPKDFCLSKEGGSDFANVYLKVKEAYPRIRRETRTLEKTLQRLTHGDQAVELVHLMAFARYVQLPPGLLLLFAEMVSTEIKALETQDTRANLIKLIQKIKRSVEWLEEYIRSQPNNGLIFNHMYDETQNDRIVLAKALMLKRLSDAFNGAE